MQQLFLFEEARPEDSILGLEEGFFKVRCVRGDSTPRLYNPKEGVIYYAREISEVSETIAGSPEDYYEVRWLDETTGKLAPFCHPHATDRRGIWFRWRFQKVEP